MHSIVLYGSIPPNLPRTLPRPEEESGAGESRTKGEDDPYLVAEKTAMDQGKAWMAVHGTIWYDDIFGTTHWTKFCFGTTPSA